MGVLNSRSCKVSGFKSRRSRCSFYLKATIDATVLDMLKTKQSQHPFIILLPVTFDKKADTGENAADNTVITTAPAIIPKGHWQRSPSLYDKAIGFKGVWTAHHKGQGINRRMVMFKGFRQEVKLCPDKRSYKTSGVDSPTGITNPFVCSMGKIK